MFWPQEKFSKPLSREVGQKCAKGVNLRMLSIPNPGASWLGARAATRSRQRAEETNIMGPAGCYGRAGLSFAGE
jgi:hypothetical protein